MDELSEAEQIIAVRTDTLHALRRYYLRLHYVGLCPLDPDEYYEDQLDRKPYREPKDKSKKLARKDAGVTPLLRLQALFSESSRHELNQREALAEDKRRDLAEEHARMVEEERAAYLERQKRFNRQVDERRRSYLDGEPKEAIQYFEEVLLSDRFSLELADQPQPYDSAVRVVSYDGTKKALDIRYRVPESEEICVIDSFVDNKKEEVIEAKYLTKTRALKVRMQVLHAILVRTAALVFYSDPYQLVDTLTITGYLEYFDSAYGRRRAVDVVRATIAEKDFLEVDLERVRPGATFDRLFHPKVSSGLYSKEPYELKAIV